MEGREIFFDLLLAALFLTAAMITVTTIAISFAQL